MCKMEDEMKDGQYGIELILDIHDCDPITFQRANIKTFFTVLCDRIDMEAEDLHFWDDLDTPEEEKETEPHLIGTSAIQFIRTSNITIHTLDIMKRVYLNIFSCKDFDENIVRQTALDFFGGIIVSSHLIERM